MHTLAHGALTNSHPRSRSALAGAAAWLDRAYRRWQEQAADRRALALMSDRDLRDARLSRWEVERELSRPFWRG